MPPSGQSPDTETAITHIQRLNNPFPHAVAGLHIGRMNPQPKVSEFDAVLTLAADPGTVEHGTDEHPLRHRHIPLPYIGPMDMGMLDEAENWAFTHVQMNRKVLIRSEGGRQRPGLVAGLIILRLGGCYYDAMSCVHHADMDALTDFRYLNLMRERGRKLTALP